MNKSIIESPWYKPDISQISTSHSGVMGIYHPWENYPQLIFPRVDICP